MTLDELEALSDKELQIKAAELDGWRCTDEVTKGPYDQLAIRFGDGLIIWMHGNERVPCQKHRVPYPDYLNDIAAAMDLALSIGDRYWMELHTPFRKGDPFFAGFTPLGTSGWDGRPDNQCEAEKPGKAITRAFVLTVESEDREGN